MKKFLILVLTIIMCCNIIACGSSKEPTIDSETITVDYETITDDISTAVLAMDNCARIQKQWLGVSNNLPYLYSDTNYTGGNNDEAKEAGTDCYKFRTVAIEKMEAAKTSLKGGSGDYHNAVQEYYLAANWTKRSRKQLIEWIDKYI